MTPEEKYELYERKINGELSVAEEETLSMLIEKDESIAEEFKVYKEWSAYLESNLDIEMKETDLKSNLKKIGDSYFKEEKYKKKKNKVIKLPFWLYTTAASVAIVFGVYIFTSGEPTYNDFVVIPEMTITERGGVHSTISDLEVAFNSGNYEKAEKYLLELLSADNSNSEYNFYYGITLLEQNKYSEATFIFEKLMKGNSGYKNKAIWFEALNQLKQKNVIQCKKLLIKIPKEAEDYSQAQKLMKGL